MCDLQDVTGAERHHADLLHFYLNVTSRELDEPFMLGYFIRINDFLFLPVARVTWSLAAYCVETELWGFFLRNVFDDATAGTNDADLWRFDKKINRSTNFTEFIIF